MDEKEKNNVEEEIIEYKVYKEKPYCNSDKNPLGVSINGKTKEYIYAHSEIKKLMIKKKKYSINNVDMKICDVTNVNSTTNAIIEVSDEKLKKGNVELKIYAPSVHRKKGATIEMRKMANHDYVYVTFLKGVITSLLDGFILGDEADKVLMNLKSGNPRKCVSKVTAKPKPFTCDQCDWQTKFASALKIHKKKIHEVNLIPCNICDFKFETNDDLKKHINENHTRNKRSKSEEKSSTPTSSPPRKKIEMENILEKDESIEMMDIEIEANSLVVSLLEKRIKELEGINKNLEITVQELKSQSADFSAKNVSKPKHLANVHEEHLKDLKGYSLRYRALGDGACATNSIAVHIHEDEKEAPKLKRRVLNHIADNYYNFYKDRISIPYTETVGVGNAAKVVTIETDEEMIDFLKSNDALKVYANSHELLAVANLYNVAINIFTYGGGSESINGWSQILPDSEMVAETEAKLGKWIPDIALYYCSNSHYDLLVKRDSRLALLGFAAGYETTNTASKKQENIDSEEKSEEWKTVGKKKIVKQVGEDDILLKESIEDTGDKDIGEEIVLLKKSGFIRTGPQVSSVPHQSKKEKQEAHKCGTCNFEFQSAGILKAHLMTHQNRIECDLCEETFKDHKNLEEHIQMKHSQEENLEWNCDNCAFQAHSPSELMKHLKLTLHQPSKTVHDKRKVFEDYKQCYTCKMDFDGFVNLMNHRKAVHPSNKKCRYYPEGTCTWNDKCWYVHKNEDDTDMVNNFKCDLCEKVFTGRNSFMNHRKLAHPDYVPTCENFSTKRCQRGNECWFLHKLGTKYTKAETTKDDVNVRRKLEENKTSKNSVFWKDLGNTFPPDQSQTMMDMVKQLFMKMEKTLMENMEKRFQTLTK